MSEMVVIDGIRYRVEDAPKVKVKPEPKNKMREVSKKGVAGASGPRDSKRGRAATSARAV